MQGTDFVNIFQASERQEKEAGKQQKAQQKNTLIASPMADAKLFRKICELIQQLLPLKQVVKGVNEVLKGTIKGALEVVVLAADCDPIEIIMTLPSECENRHIQYCFVPSKAVLGRACGIKRPVVAAAILFKDGSHLTSQIMELKDKIEQLFI